MTDTERMEWLEQQRCVTIYRSATGHHWVYVNELASTRAGVVAQTFRGVIDAARLVKVKGAK